MNATTPSNLAPADMTDAERELHIASLGQHMEQAYARFQAHRNPQDRDEAIQWHRLQLEAIQARSDAQKARMTLAIDQGLDYFQTEGDRARRMALARGFGGTVA